MVVIGENATLYRWPFSQLCIDCSNSLTVTEKDATAVCTAAVREREDDHCPLFSEKEQTTDENS